MTGFVSQRAPRAHCSIADTVGGGVEAGSKRGESWRLHREGDAAVVRRDEVSAVRCGGITLDDRALTLRGVYARSIGDERAWAMLPATEADAWRLVALAAMHGCYAVDGV